MIKLPKGYYAVVGLNTAENERINDSTNSFCYKGVTYEVEEGVNLFTTITEALAAATETPETVIEGLDYPEFKTPVILLSEGRHLVGKDPKTVVAIRKSVTVLGQKAGVNPNLPAEDTLLPQTFNPERADESQESMLRGGYDFGTWRFADPKVGYFVLDGVTCIKDVRFADYRVNEVETDIKLIFRNIVHKSPMGFAAYVMDAIGSGKPYTREVVFENIRFEKDFFDLGYGGICFRLVNNKTTIDNFCMDGTYQIFGFTNIIRSASVGCPTAELSEINIKNSYLARFRSENGIATTAATYGLKLNLENTTLVDASREGESPLQVDLTNEKSSLTLKGCRIVDTRGNKAVVEIRGEGKDVTIEDTTFEGFETTFTTPRELPTEAPVYIDNKAEDWQTECEDAHTVIGTDKADFSALDAYYEDCKAYYGDLHTHSKCGGTSDGQTPIEQWVENMDKLSLDFAILVDHRQMRGYFLPEWNEERFVMGTEPGCTITDPLGPNCTRANFHYNMIFPHKYGLAMVLANFPEYKFKGDELTGKFGYPSFTRERIFELNDYLRSIGGMLVHAHPRTLMGSANPLDYYFGEHSYIETMVWGYASQASFRSYDTWVDILNLGKHVYASGGSDTHGPVSASCPSTFYTKKRFHSDFVDRMYHGDYAVGGVGVKMFIDGKPMGSELVYKDGMKLTLRVDDFFKHTFKEDTVYELQVITDKGVAYSSLFDGTKPQALSIEVQKRAYYRVVVNDITHGYRVCVSNPIWLDKVEEEAAE